ncbi:PEP-CTERM sorting domain-containing protein [Nostoc sp. FACHB-152]|uniref:choice-of-anchor E domain-containing protein n=1 Tax=unclassified Nostoc TaxID=2593658 RepID=UPI001683078E|nr:MULTISPECIES: PEP-CTERM sorting domain-containing protein [unclassified Nostoc]MBD2447271.1 PEP-CTERM sorting domain-containing protein [Nostoc sp. FACHB-152]MBD2468128.1 PEP-CTERM sorting domain-containing protein [Nostoc sp. FACHB-145]
MTTKLLQTLAAATTLAGIVATTGAANAASISYTGSTNYIQTDFDGELLSLTKFNSALGTLKGVTLGFTGDITGDGSLKNKNTNPNNTANLTVHLTSDLDLKLKETDQSLLALNVSTNTGSYSLKGQQTTNIQTLTGTQSATQNYTLGSNLFSSFIGSGDLDLLFSATAKSVLTGSGNILADINTFARANVTVTYDYDPAKSVPEPSTVIGMGLFAGIGLLSQRKKSLFKASN